MARQFERARSMFFVAVAAIVLVPIASGCERARSLVVMQDGAAALHRLSAAEATGDLAYADPFPPYEAAPTSGRSRVFLVALSGDLANFAQEIADQRRYWLERGFGPEDIVCYYVKPTAEAYRADQAQFDALHDDLATFYPAAPSLIRRHLKEAAAAEPTTIYLYLTSHGTLPSSFRIPPRELEKDTSKYMLREHGYLNDYWLSSDAVETGTVNLLMKLHAVERGADPSDLFVTPAVVRDWLLAFPESTRKVVVLQGCFSGGFIERDPDYESSDTTTLREVPNLIAMAAARYDRPSFGCSPGRDRTIFGETWLDELRRLPPGRMIDWEALFRDVTRAVDQTEARMNIPIVQRSRPVSFVASPGER